MREDNDVTRTPQEIDAEIIRLAQRQGALDEEVGRRLLLASNARLHRHFGMATFVEYIERRFGYSPRVAKDKARVALALEDLPHLRESLIAGEISWSATKELVRVAKPVTEDAWIEAARGKTIREVEKLVSGMKPGDAPTAAADPLLARRRFVLDLSGEEYAIWLEGLERTRKAGNPRWTDAEAALAMAEQTLGTGRQLEAQPAYQVALTSCVDCGRTGRHAAGELIEVPESVRACAECDGEIVGFTESPASFDPLLSTAAPEPTLELTHVGQERSAFDNRSADIAALHRLVRRDGISALLRETSHALGWTLQKVTPRVRKLVFARDQYRCAVPGCRCRLFLEVHHLKRVEDGGANNPENLVALCSTHHRLFHAGYLAIEGTPSTGLTFRTNAGTRYGHPPKYAAA